MASPPVELTAEKRKAKLHKNAFIIKRSDFRKNQVCLDDRDNIESAIEQHKNEILGIKTNWKVVTDQTKLDEDRRIKNEILRLLKEEKEGRAMLKEMKTNLDFTNRKIAEMSKWSNMTTNKSKEKATKRESNQKRLVNEEKNVYTKTIMYNKSLEELKDLRQKFDAVNKKMLIKKEKFDNMMTRLKQQTKHMNRVIRYSMGIKEKMKELAEDENEEEAYLKKLLVDFEENIIMIRQKCRDDYNMTQFMQLKVKNRHEKITKKKEIVPQRNREKMIEQMRELIQVCGTNNLKKILEFIDIYEHEHEVSLLDIALGQKNIIEKKPHVIRQANLGIYRKEWRINRKPYFKERLESHTETLNELDIHIKWREKTLNYVVENWPIVTQGAIDLYKAFKMDEGAEYFCGVEKVPMTPYNLRKFFCAMGQRVWLVLIVLNCIQESCLTGPNDDPLSSDYDPILLVSKDLHGVEVKLHRYFNYLGKNELKRKRAPIVKRLDASHLPKNTFTGGAPCSKQKIRS